MRVSLSDTLLMSVFSDQTEKGSVAEAGDDGAAKPVLIVLHPLVGDRPPLPVSQARMCKAQRADPTLKESPKDGE